MCWRWALPGWCALTLGIILARGPTASWGWAAGGGSWDPVENASLLPSSFPPARCYIACISRASAIFRHWSPLLAIVTLILSLLGTPIVRLGILVSVHAALDNVRAAPLLRCLPC